ncbi:MAG: Cof-type HAD-IIB family hydrolase [Bacteroidales bacterium]|nr:Cof-type HAD-IIB family hydrolase [Bacteroidales bacterium]
MIKAAFFDIDGTLLSFTTHRISEGTVRAFDTLHRHGVRTFISSGRPKVLIPPMPVTFEAYITMNGALVFTTPNPNERLTLVSNPIPQEDLNAWLDFAKQHNLCTMIFTADGMMLAQPNEVGMKLRDQLEFTMPPVVTIDEMRNHTAYQIIALMPADLDAHVASLLPHCRLPRWHPAFTDIVADGNSKAVGMEALCRHFGICQADTIAFGDGANDIEMLQWAGIGIAMGNAEPAVKQHADMVTTPVDEEGIEQAVNQLFS